MPPLALRAPGFAPAPAQPKGAVAARGRGALVGLLGAPLPSRRPLQVAAVMTGSRISRQPTASKPARKPATARSSPPASPKKRTFFLTYSPPEPAPPAPPSRSSLPAVLAGLSGVGMLGAAVWLLCGPVCPVWCHDPTTLAATAVSASNTIHQYGPADLVTFSGRTFGPTRPVWALLLHHQQTAHAAAAAAVGEGSWSAGLAGDTRAAAESAAAAAHGTFEQLRGGYNTWLEASPLPCKVVTGNFFTIAGDMLAQLGNIGGGHGGGSSAAAAGGRKRVDLMRTLRLCLETSLLGTPLAHFWFGMLDAKILPDDPHSPAAVMTKMLLDQVLFAPAGLLMFFVAIKLLEGRARDIPDTLRTSYVKALLGGYLLWPAAGILNFALLPPEYRLLFNNCVNVLWTCFLSIMSSSPETEEDSAPPAAAPEPAAAVAQQLAAAAVGAAVITASAAGPPSLGFVAGLAVAVLEAAFATTSSAATPGTTLELACVAGPADHQPSASPTFNVMDALCHELREAPMGAQP